MTSPHDPLLARLSDETVRELGQASMLTGPVAGRFLELLVWIAQPLRVLEIGTFSGHSALAMAAGLPEGGHIDACEVDPERAAFAQGWFDRSPHGSRITLHVGPAAETIASLGGEFDFVFIDADKGGYISYYEAVLPRLAPRGADRRRQHAGRRQRDRRRSADRALQRARRGRPAVGSGAVDRPGRPHPDPPGLSVRTPAGRRRTPGSDPSRVRKERPRDGVSAVFQPIRRVVAKRSTRRRALFGHDMGSDPQTCPIERSPRPFVAEVAEHELVRETTDREECRPSRPSNVSPAFSRTLLDRLSLRTPCSMSVGSMGT